MAIKTVAFIGTGIMGAPIAGHILDAGYKVVVYNRSAAKAETLLNKGAMWADSVAEAAQNSDLIFTMLGFPFDVEEVYLGSEGLLRSAKRGAYLVDLTTSSPELARDIAEAAELEGIHAFDCPVTGGQAGAIAGTLTAIVGATKEVAQPVSDVISTFTNQVFYFDAPGQGQVAKLCNQVALAGAMMGVADALSLAGVSGLDVQKCADMIKTGTGTSGALETQGQKMIDGDYAPGFMVEHYLKDLGLALELAENQEIALPGTQTAFGLYDMLEAIGGARLGHQSISLLYQEEADAVAAGLDWSLLNYEEVHEGCDCGCEEGHHDHHAHNHECGCAHEKDSDHECCGGHGHHHEDGHECCGGHGHHHREGHCNCGQHE